MLYYLWASYTAFRPEDLTPGAVKDALDSYASGCGAKLAERTSCLSATSARLASIIQRMVAKVNTRVMVIKAWFFSFVSSTLLTFCFLDT